MRDLLGLPTSSVKAIAKATDFIAISANNVSDTRPCQGPVSSMRLSHYVDRRDKFEIIMVKGWKEEGKIGEQWQDLHARYAIVPQRVERSSRCHWSCYTLSALCPLDRYKEWGCAEAMFSKVFLVNAASHGNLDICLSFVNLDHHQA